jgi:hypothetical protein
MNESTKQSISLEELAERQGVSAVSDLDEISALWPADDDPDQLLHHILRERTERRGVRTPPGRFGYHSQHVFRLRSRE